MSFLIRIIFLVLSNALAIYVAARFVPGISFVGTAWQLLATGAVLGFINAFVRPVLKLLSFPLIILTLGLFTVIINIAMLMLASYLMPALAISGFWAAFWGTIIISIVNFLIGGLVKD